MSFRLIKVSKLSCARGGVFKTAHGSLKTPFFMPIATKGAVKSLTAEDLKKLEAQIVLSNTYHLWQRPGLAVIRKAQGLHKYMNWPGPILTDSGGYQVFSLSRQRKIIEKGVEFVSILDGKKHLLTPEKAIQIQLTLGSDISMSLDECPPYPSSKKYALDSLEMTTRWATRGQKYFKKNKKTGQKLFGIVQGSVYQELRKKSTDELLKLKFDGYAVGGLAVGEPVKTMYEVLDFSVGWLPADKPRYLMGVGKPDQIVAAVKRGIDMFDCVIPTRNARHGLLYVWKTNSLSGNFYDEMRIKKSMYLKDMRPLDKKCGCYCCQNYSRSYLRHMFMTKDPLAYRLATLHNLHFYLSLMKKIRSYVRQGKI